MLVDLAFMSYVPMLFISAKTGQRVNKVMELAEFAYEQNWHPHIDGQAERHNQRSSHDE